MSDPRAMLARRPLVVSSEDADPEDDSASVGASSPQVDGISSLVALALEKHVPLFADGFIDNASAVTVRAGGGGFAVVNISRIAKNLSRDKYSWYGEQQLQFPSDWPTGKKVAVKTASKQDNHEAAMPIISLAQEIRILSHQTLRKHPNLVEIIALGWSGTIHDDSKLHPRFPVLWMEYADCGTLEDFFGLEDIVFDWQLKVGISYDVAQGLEALEDSGVIHGDLKPTNVLVFRAGNDSFTAKLCDFGSALIPVDLPLGAPLRQHVITPPWNAPESSQDLDFDEAYKVDIYSYGLLLCSIFLEGLDPFSMKYESIQDKHSRSLMAYVQEWKNNDCVSDICKSAVRQFGKDSFQTQQLKSLDRLFDITLGTNVESRVEEHSEIKAILRPDLAGMDAAKRSKRFTSVKRKLKLNFNRQNFSWESIGEEHVPRLFPNSLAESVPNMMKCWHSMLPPNIAVAIVEDLRNIISINTENSLSEDVRERVSTAAYELSICHIQGYGCETSYEQAAQLLIQSAEMDNRRAQNDLIRVLGALSREVPPSVKGQSVQWTMDNALSGSPSAMEELDDLDPSLSAIVKHLLRTELSPFGTDIFGDEIRGKFDLQDSSAFMDQIAHHGGHLPIDDEDYGSEFTWLHYAATNGASAVVRKLVQLPDCDVDCRTTTGYTPLWMACAAGHSDVAEILIDRGANVKIASNFGRSCLHYLQQFDSDVAENIAGRLIAAGADVAVKDRNGETPLMSSCIMKEGRDAIPAVKYLIQIGADPTAIGSCGYTCIDIVTMNLNANLLHLLLSSSIFEGEGGASLSIDARARALNKLLIIPKYQRFRAGASDRQSKTKEVLDMLLAPGDVVAKYMRDSPDWRSPLLDACIWDCSDLIEPLLSYDSMNINHFTNIAGENKVNLLPLFETVKLAHTELAKTLVDRDGADIALHDSENRNILHFTVEFAPDLFDFFLSRLQRHGCDIQAFINAGTRQQGFTPLDMAVRAEKFDIANRLIALGAQYREFTRLGQAGERYSSLGMCGGSRAQMSFFLDMPSEDRSRDLIVCHTGFTLFHMTAVNFDNALTEQDASPADNITFLLNHYASREDANRGDLQGNTPLHFAVRAGNTSVARTLLELAGADVNARDQLGRTPLDDLEFRKRDFGHDIKELQLVDDMEKRNWKEKTQRMQTLLRDKGAVTGADLE